MHKKDSVGITPKYFYTFDFEKRYSYVDTQKWLMDNVVFFFVCNILYLTVIVCGRFYMLNKPRYNVRGPLTLWCLLNALFSIMGFSRTAPELIFAIRHHDFFYSVCIPSNYLQNPVSGFWTWALVLSKIVQLCDTIFLLFNKQRLPALHVYHQVYSILYFWITYIHTTAVMRWIAVMEYFFHFLMYSYHTLKTVGFYLPRFVARTIIGVQIIQSVISCILIIVAYDPQHARNLNCHITFSDVLIGVFYYFVSFILYLDTF